MLYRREGSEFWWVQFKHRGERIRRSTGKAARKEAEIEARRIRVEVEQETGPGGRAAGVTLAALEELHVEYLERKGRSEGRVTTVENLWSNLQRHLGATTDVGALQASDIERYEGLRRNDEAPHKAVGQTIRREVQALHKAMKLAKRDRLISRMPFDWEDLDPIESDPAKREQEAKVRELADIRKVLSKLSKKAHTAGHPPMLRFILATGLRLEEFRRCGEEASEEGRHPWLRPAPSAARRDGVKALLAVPADSSKTGDSRTLPLSAEAVATLEEWGPQFAGKKFNHALKLASKAAKVSPVLTPRDLRATYLDLAAKHDPLAAQKLGGHRNISTTGLYLDASTARAVAAGARAAKEAGGHSKGPQQQQRRRKAQ